MRCNRRAREATERGVTCAGDLFILASLTGSSGGLSPNLSTLLCTLGMPATFLAGSGGRCVVAVEHKNVSFTAEIKEQAYSLGALLTRNMHLTLKIVCRFTFTLST